MPRVVGGSYDIEWDERGDRNDPTVLLIMGLGAQMIAFREGFCDDLERRGLHVVRFDNRDAGLSGRSAGHPPDHKQLARLILAPERTPPVYTLSDMADDAVRVLDAVSIDRCHVVGVSMGGMIAQTMAVEHSHRVASLTSIMSKPGSFLAGRPSLGVLAGLLGSRPTEREAAFRHELQRAGRISGPLFDRDDTERYLSEAYDRAFNPQGMGFQLAAILAAPDRTARLGDLDVPSLVIHGRKDPLVSLSGGVATARAIPNASLVVHDRMGHQLSRPFWTPIVDDIAAQVRRAERVCPRSSKV